MQTTIIATVLLLTGASAGQAQCVTASAPRIAAIAGVFATGETAAIALRHSDWWEPPRRSFHTIWGTSASKGQDGLLHGAIAYHTSQVATLAWDWACVSRRTAGWLGALTGVAVALPKEIGDGLHQNGFSGPDMLFTAAGALLPAMHRQWPLSRAIALKALYWPSAEFRNRTGPLPSLENDYAGQRYFLSLNPARSGGAGPWPDWLGIAVGHGVPSWVTVPPVHDWYITLDLEARGLPIRASWWHGFATVLDQIHFPMPGLRLRAGRIQAGLF